MRYVSARHDSGVCTCLDESGLCLSILVYLLGLIFVFSSSLAFISLAFISHFSMLLLLFFRSLVRLASLSSLFFPLALATCRRVRMGSTPRWSCGALPIVSQLSVRSRGALLRRLGLRRCACDSKMFYGRSCTPLPTPIIFPAPSKCTGALQCSRSLALLLVGRTGW